MKKHQAKKVTCFLDLLTEEEVVNLYKHFTGVTQVKFKDRQSAETALLNASFGRSTAQMVEAFKVTQLGQETIDQYGTMLRGPIAFPEGRMTPKQLKEHAKALGEGKKADKAKQPADPKQPNAASAAVLLALRELIPADAKDDALSVSSADVAKKLDTNINAVCKAADSLAKQKLVEVEDDSHEQGHQFYWLSLTPEGRDIKVTTPSVRLPQSNPGPRSGFNGKFIFKISKTNPRREGTHGWKSWNLLQDGMSFEEYRKAGGRNNDLQWDLDKGFCELRDSKDGAPAKTPPPAKAKAAAAAATPSAPPAKMDKGQILKPSAKQQAAKSAKKKGRK
jgi:hypothetical protein